MSSAIDFFERWSNEHVNAVPFPEHQGEAQRLAKQFRSDAERAGIALEALEEDLTQDLVSEFVDRLDTRANEEIAASASRD